ncbi:MAG: ABC transporter permease [Lachnospiraceae bacterium]|nr:ABC transporter permease [Lachnospiraceae bacterium]
MKKVSFLIQNAWKYILYNKFSSIVLFIAITVGFIFPMMALNDVNDLLRDVRISRYEDASGITILEYQMPYKEGTEMDAALKQAEESGMFERVGFSGNKSQLIYAGEESYSGIVSGVSAEYLSLMSCELVKGSFFSEEDYEGTGERVCLLRHESGLVRDGVGVGDSIEILGNSYTVKGIVRSPRIYGGVLVPYVFSSEIFAGTGEYMSYQVITYGHTGKTVVIPFPDQLYSSKEAGVEQEKIYLASVRELNRYRMMRAWIIILFTAVNMLLLFMGMMVRERYSMAVRMALGVSRKALFLEVLFRNLLLMLPALLAAVVCYPLLGRHIRSINRGLQAVTVLQAGLGGVVIISLITLVILRFSFKKRGVAALLKK